MSKIFLTGMTAPQSSPRANEKNVSFGAQIYRTLVSVGHEVTWANPSIYMTEEFFSQYDSVIVGISPISGLSSDRAYGALSIIETLWGDSRLTMFIDAPSVAQLTSNINTLAEEPEKLKKPFFSYKREFSNLNSDSDAFIRVSEAVKKLKSEDWGITLYPRLPWNLVDSVKLPPNAKKELYGINLDSIYIFDSENAERAEKWVIDGKNPKWEKSVTSSLVYPVVPMKFTKRDDDDDVASQISRSMGALIAPDPRAGTWWNYRYVQALSYETPIISDWKDTRVLGEAWELLASSIEDMSQSKRNLIALAQKESYLASIPSIKNAISDLLEKIRILEVSAWQK